MNILITGSSGQIGTNLALALQARGTPPPRILGIDKRQNSWTDQIPTLILDMTQPPTQQSLAPALQFKPDIIVHLAAWAKVHQLVKEPDKAFENVAMTHWALELARHAKDGGGVPIIFGSSREVYGDVRRHVTEESQADHVIAESPYSASKIAAEAFFSSYAKCYGLKTLIFRFSNVYGRYDNDLARMERVIPLFVQKISAGEPITVFGKDKMLDFTYIDDCVSGVIAGIDALSPGTAVPELTLSSETINLAYGQGQTLYDLVTLIELATNKKAIATYLPSQTGEVTRYVADITKARQLLGYNPQTPLTRGILNYVQWCRQTNFIP
ncbi:MAG: NAD-dependent epimerase/dehydratase family protein [Phycisphaerales bacterium]|nr:NAD-dependent epimerase/dehydratase family protein [Phycisphaerales bacterium]